MSIVPQPAVSGFSVSGLPFNNGEVIQGFGGWGTGPSGEASPSSGLGAISLVEPNTGALGVGGAVYRTRYTSTAPGNQTGWSFPRVTNNKVLTRTNGFGLFVQFAIPVALPANTVVYFAATDNNNAIIPGNPSALNAGIFGIACDSGDANWQLVAGTSGAGNFTKTDTGFPKTQPAGLYSIAWRSLAGAASVQVWFAYIASGASSTAQIVNGATLSGNIPGAAAGLQITQQITSAGNTLQLDYLYSRFVVPYPAALPSNF